ncbi:YbaN family protein [Macellibacteroides fermentans]|uniref:YbaN family protein n=1 Tax=Macellibacteroides fermentans TaxID=879969 RepID=UPI00406BE904
MRSAIKKYILIILGSFSLILGIVGIFLPILPTTPFLLLSSYCYVRSSARLYHWLIHHKVLGPYLYNYKTHKAILKRTKIGAIIVLWSSLILSIFLVKNWHVTVLLLLVGVCVSVHLNSLKSVSKEEFFSIIVSEDIEKP